MKPTDELKQIVARLRAPDGCPWDREQTHETIKPQLVEECYEVLEAIDEKNDPLLREELGDVLLHIVFHAQLAGERGAFTLEDVAQELCEKLIRRHPHVFGEDNLSTSQEVLHRWEELKKIEKPERTGVLDGIPKHLPALMHAQEVQKKAAKVGFDWPEIGPVLEKVKEEIAEVERDLHNRKRTEEEIGDLLFSVVNLARHCKVDAEEACRQAVRKFTQRFEWIEKHATRPPKEMSLDELDALWNQAKKQGL